MFIPLMEEWFHVLTSSPIPIPHSPSPEPTADAGSNHSTNSLSSDAFGSNPNTVQGTLKEAIQSIKTTGSLPYAARTAVKRIRSASTNPNDDPEWELITQGSPQGKNPPTDFIPSLQYLVPVWECLQEVYKPPPQQVKEGSLNFQDMMPDLLFGDLDPSLHIPVPDHYVVKQEDRAMFLRHYYSEGVIDTFECKPVGAEKMVCLSVGTFHFLSLPPPPTPPCSFV